MYEYNYHRPGTNVVKCRLAALEREIGHRNPQFVSICYSLDVFHGSFAIYSGLF